MKFDFTPRQRELIEKARYADTVLFKTIEAKCALEVLIDTGVFDRNIEKQIVNTIIKLEKLEPCLRKIKDEYYDEFNEL